jgi:predicted lactoylglutathione lyase
MGAFSISLAVADIHASKAFYEKLGSGILTAMPS